MTVFELIEKQQAGKENTDAWMVGEQLKDICGADPHCADLVEKDLQDKSMNLTACAAKIRAYADRQPRKGNCVCVPPNVAEGIIREFYGLPGAAPKQEQAAARPAPLPEDDGLDLMDFL